MTAEDLWYAAHGCLHAHCSLGCQKPQPFVAADGRLLCGRCSVYDGEAVECVPCVPATCAGD